MSQSLPDNYVEEVPDDVDMSQSEWADLSYHGQYHHVERDKERVNRVKKERYDRKKRWLDRIKAGAGCTVCSEDEPACLDFHHIKDKNFQLADAPRRDIAMDKIKREVKKCVVVCANCHRKHHAGLLEL